MNTIFLILCFFGSMNYFTGTVAHEAIVGGGIVSPLDVEYRYQVLIMIPNRNSTCGGGILDNHSVLTAAHCVFSHRGLIGAPITILAGTYNLLEPGIIVQVEKIYVPWADQRIAGDIAILKLKQSLDTKRNFLLTLQIAWNRTETDFVIGRIAGFGWDKFYVNQSRGANSDHHLRFAYAKLRNHTECQIDHPHRRISEKKFCARLVHYPTEDRGVCVGDTGGPLVIEEEILIGILSAFAPNCSEKRSSGLYTSALQYKRFLTYANRATITSNDIRVFYV